MPVEEYEEKAFKEMPYYKEQEYKPAKLDSRGAYAYNDQMDALFANVFQPVAVYVFPSRRDTRLFPRLASQVCVAMTD